jgi:YHS domain-containing protein
VSNERLRLRQDHTQELMRAAEKAHAEYTVIADRLMDSVIRPRMAAVKAQMDTVATGELECRRHACRLRLVHTPRFPATVRLEAGVTRDGDMRSLIVEYRLDILPVFFPFDGSDDLTFPMNEVEPEQVASWLDDKLVAFVEAYLRLEIERPYQEENRVSDPVCGMTVNRAEATARAEYGGKTYYFCIAECRDRFLANPERYVPRPAGEH